MWPGMMQQSTIVAPMQLGTGAAKHWKSRGSIGSYGRVSNFDDWEALLSEIGNTNRGEMAESPFTC